MAVKSRFSPATERSRSAGETSDDCAPSNERRSSVLEISNLTCGYGTREIVSDFSASIRCGEVFCLLGPNGIGKTTLFKTVLGIIPRLGGNVTVDGRPLEDYDERKRAQLIGYVPQAHTPPFAFTVRDIVVMGRIAHVGMFASPTTQDYELADSILETLGLQKLSNRIYTELSGGERQMVLIARALAQQPTFLMMDEPTSNLDFGNQARVLKTVRRLAGEGLGIIMTTHFPEHVAQCRGRGTLLMRGNRRVDGGIDDLLTAETLQQAYGIDCLVADVASAGRTMKVCQPIIDE